MSYSVSVEKLESATVSAYDKRVKKVVYYLKLKSNQVGVEIIENNDFYVEGDFAFKIVKKPYRPSVYLDKKLVDLYEEIVKKINQFKLVFPKRTRAIITIFKHNDEKRETTKNENNWNI